MDQRLYFARPSDLNDPFEFNPFLNYLGTEKQKRNYFRGIVNRQLRAKSRQERRKYLAMMANSEFEVSLTEAFHQTMRHVGIISLTLDPINLLMWPHYADNHKGGCVQMDYIALTHSVTMPINVNYCSDRPIFHALTDVNEVIMQKVALTKGLPWAYEQEWRLIETRKGGQLIQVREPLVTGVILGARISATDREDVIGWVKESKRNILVYEAKIHDRAYSLEMQQIPIEAAA